MNMQDKQKQSKSILPGIGYENSAFTPFENSPNLQALASIHPFVFHSDNRHPLCLLAVNELQTYLKQNVWKHNFGLGLQEQGTVIGKMFGVLVVRTREGELGYLSAFSGKLAGENHHSKLVPPIFDGLAEDGFLNAGMEKISQLNEEIRRLESLQTAGYIEQVLQLKSFRKEHSKALQDRIFDQYHFLNKSGQLKSLVDIFLETSNRKPPAGAGECAAPKLLHYAFRYQMEPLTLAEFWWGASPKSTHWKHGHFYAPCLEKCGPILAHMLS